MTNGHTDPSSTLPPPPLSSLSSPSWRETARSARKVAAALSLSCAPRESRASTPSGRSPPPQRGPIASDQVVGQAPALEVRSFGEFGEKGLTAAPMADSTRPPAMRRSIFERELLPRWRSRLWPKSRRMTSGRIVAKVESAVRRQRRSTSANRQAGLGFAVLHGEKVANPADDVGPASIATFAEGSSALADRDRICSVCSRGPDAADHPARLRLYLLTMVRKSELLDAVWDEVDFANAVWISRRNG